MNLVQAVLLGFVKKALVEIFLNLHGKAVGGVELDSRCIHGVKFPELEVY